MANQYHGARPVRAALTHRLVSSIKSIKKRNLLRGYIQKSALSDSDVDAIRGNNSPHDSMIAGALLKGENGLINSGSRRDQRAPTSADLYSIVRFRALDWRSEVAYSAGFLNSLKQKAIQALSIMRPLSRIETLEADASLQLLHSLAKSHGASNFLSYKLAYVRSAVELSPDQLARVTEIEGEIQHRNSPGLHFSALENLSSQVSIFVVARRRIGVLIERVQGDFRRSITLHNFIPTPLDEEDVAGFLLRSTESSIVDTLYAIITIFNLTDDFANAKFELEARLGIDIVDAIKDLIDFASKATDEGVVTDFYRSQNEDDYASLNVYRISAAFLERRRYAMYRNTLDRVIGARLLADVLGDKFHKYGERALSGHDQLFSPNGEVIQKEELCITLDPFYRTVLFLDFLKNRENILTMTQAQVKFIFENTTGLDSLLVEGEMRALYLTAPEDLKGFLTVLALALYRKKSVDPDVDFEFRSDLISYVQSAHQGSILAFINDLLDDSPAIATYLVGSLDEVTLEKMYTLVRNASDASRIQMEILRAVGRKLNSIDYLVQADAILTRSKVSKLQQYFDSSRMYVDSVSMHKWLDANPTIATEQFRSANRKTQARNISGDTSPEQFAKLLLQQIDDEEYLIQQIVKDAFEQFCLNNEFGIQSYLGRRIRHNTLQGVMIETVDAILGRPEHQAIKQTPGVRNSIQSWLSSYGAMIEKLRREQLQFKSNQSLFTASLDFKDPTTAENVRQLYSALRVSAGADLLNELVISFCWKQITPQLESASRYIKTTLLNEASSSIDHHFSRFASSQAENRLKSDLHEALSDVFKKVASWFQVPQTGFITTSVRDLVHIILIDLGKAVNDVEFVGDALDLKFTGISVHRIYDCLAVLLQNAYKHGKESSKIVVSANVKGKTPSTALTNVTMNISQDVVDEEFERSKSRIKQAMESREAGSDMVTEGYTGIKKLKFITRTAEGVQTITANADNANKRITMGFSLHAENAIEEINPL